MDIESYPKAFMSHSHQNAELVHKVAGLLRERGVNAWLDKWELSPGDSLVDKIFTDGISKSDLIVIFLSKASVQSNWVKEELDHAAVRRIQEKVRVIPVVIDRDIEIPPSLITLFRLSLFSDDDIDEVVGRIVDVAWGRSVDKPSLGPGPQMAPVSVSGMTDFGVQMGMLLIDKTERLNSDYQYVSVKVFEDVLGFSPDEINEGYYDLDSNDLVDTTKAFGIYPYRFGHIRPKVLLWHYLKSTKAFDYDLEKDLRVVAALVENEKFINGETIRAKTDLPPLRINHAVEYLSLNSLVEVDRWMGTSPFVFGRVRATIATRRFLNENVF
ncbi:toll/interleukin-1 receptor domain-containing protein [Lujinxingia vulgaris]|uniref:Toll/interleukin-1 receptor domain-containing protein n=1 Tax=Lujinxingia vulgaris TaxID=2600176 RepID=A0A5C6XI86_9DELT|nr:toll/interleukin-1 receptor domain-containing protein [Lujinxingia vulgaris]TXD36982.1 toll/interleukin-1 receptor domain-containing protein [Lujinxingia vulgaris]